MVAKRVAAGGFAQDDLAAALADVFGTHYLVGRALLEHAVLVQAGGVGEGVAAYDRLVGGHQHAHVSADHAAGAEQLGGVDGGVGLVEVLSGAQGHDDLFQGGVAGALADAVDGALDLRDAPGDPGQRVGGGVTQVVVAVHRDDDIVDAGDVLHAKGDQIAEFVGHGVADGIGDVDDGRPGFDGGGQDLNNEVAVAAGGVHGREFDVRGQVAGELDGVLGELNEFGAGDVELLLEMDVGGGDYGVQKRTLGVLQRFPGSGELVFLEAGERGDLHVVEFAGHKLDGFEIAGGGGGKSGLDYGDSEFLELAADLDFFFKSQRAAGSLLAVAQGSVEYAYGPQLPVLRIDRWPPA